MKKMIFAVLAFTTVSFSGAWAQDEAKNKTNREEMFKNMVSKQADKLCLLYTSPSPRDRG